MRCSRLLGLSLSTWLAIASLPMVVLAAPCVAQTSIADAGASVAIPDFSRPADGLLSADQWPINQQSVNQWSVRNSVLSNVDSNLPAKSVPDKNAEDETLATGSNALGAGARDESQIFTCFTMRTYRVVRVDRNTDVVRPAGYSTCPSAAKLQVKTIENSPELIRR